MSTRGKQFEPGNKYGKGRPRGSRNKKSWLLQQQLLDEGEEILSKVIALAKKGNPTAMKLCMERLTPPLKPVAELPVEQAKAASKSIRVVFVRPPNDSVADGESTNPSPKLPAPEAPGIRNQPVPFTPKFPVATPPRPKFSPWS